MSAKTPSPWSFDWDPLERELRLNIDWDDNSGYWYVYAYDDAGERYAEELNLHATVEQLEQAARRVATKRDRGSR